MTLLPCVNLVSNWPLRPTGPQEDQDMEYGYDEEFGEQQGQPPKPTSSGQSRHREREPERRTDRHPGKHRR